ncbi:MAG: 50S ribosomal protein L11 methyltransferase [Acidobacteriota bacterium]
MSEHVLEIRFDPSTADAEERIRGLLFLTGSAGDVLTEEEGTICISAFFEDSRSRRTASEAIAAIGGVRLEDVDRSPIDWIENYQQSLRSFEVGARFVVAPDRSLIHPGSRIPLIIPQEHAFGTGSHESTALCLEMLERASVDGGDCLDIGTGSGILAMAMAALGARRVFAFDNDVETFSVLAANLARNRIEAGRILQFFGVPQSVRGRFQVTTMNILPDVIVKLMPAVASLAARGGRVIFSGVVREKSADVIGSAREARLTLVEESSSGEWWCGMFVAGERLSS